MLEEIVMGYSFEIRESVIKKVLVGNKTRESIAREAGISRSTLNCWINDYKSRDDSVSSESKERRPYDWSVTERIEALMTTGAMSDEEKGCWCRQKGIFMHHLEEWKKEAINGVNMKPSMSVYSENRDLKKENAALKKELQRKEKALAETAALLVLKKKADCIWGESKEG
jgi:transposase